MVLLQQLVKIEELLFMMVTRHIIKVLIFFYIV